MASLSQPLERPAPRTYTRTDFAALRARVLGVPPHTIVRLYYDPDTAPQAASSDALDQYLRAMRDEFVRLALLNGSSVLAEHLRGSIRKHGSAKLTAVTLRMVEDAARLTWCRPVVPSAHRAAPDRGRGGDPYAQGSRRLLQPSRRPMVAVGAAYRRVARPDDCCVVAPA